MEYNRRVIEILNVVYHTLRFRYQYGVSSWNDELNVFLDACRDEAKKRGYDVDAFFEGMGLREIKTFLSVIGVWCGGSFYPFHSYTPLTTALMFKAQKDPELEQAFGSLLYGGSLLGSCLFFECEVFRHQVCIYRNIFDARHKYMPMLLEEAASLKNRSEEKRTISRAFQFRLGNVLLSSIEAPPPVLIEISLRRRAIAAHMEEITLDPSATLFDPIPFETLLTRLYIPAKLARIVLNHPNSHFIRYERDCYAPTNLRGEPLFPTKEVPQEPKSFDPEPGDKGWDKWIYNFSDHYPGGKQAFRTTVFKIVDRLDSTPPNVLFGKASPTDGISTSLDNLINSFTLHLFGSPLKYDNLPEDAELDLNLLKDAYKDSGLLFATHPYYWLSEEKDHIPQPKFDFSPILDTTNTRENPDKLVQSITNPRVRFLPNNPYKNLEAPMLFYRSKLKFHYCENELWYDWPRLNIRLELHREFDPTLSSLQCKEWGGVMTFNGEPIKRRFFLAPVEFHLTTERQRSRDYTTAVRKEPAFNAETSVEEMNIESTASETTEASGISIKGVPLDSVRIAQAREKNAKAKHVFVDCEITNPVEAEMSEEMEDPTEIEELPAGVKELGAFLRSLFDQSYVVLYYSKLLERRPDLFSPFGATTLQGARDAVRQVAQTVFPELRAGDQFVVLSTDAKLEDFDLLCFQIVLRWGNARATTPEELSKDLYIPLSIIKRTLTAGEEFSPAGSKKFTCKLAAQESRKLQAQDSRRRFAESQLAKRVDELIDKNHLLAYYDKILESTPWLKACGISDVETLKKMLGNIPKEREDGEKPRELTLHDDYVDLVEFNGATLEEKTRRALQARWARLTFNKSELEFLNAHINKYCKERPHLPETSVKRMMGSVVMSKLTLKSILRQRLSTLRSRLLLPAALVETTIRNSPHLFQFDETTQLFVLLNEKGTPATRLDAVRIILRGYDGSLPPESATAKSEEVEPQVAPPQETHVPGTETESAPSEDENAPSESSASEDATTQEPATETVDANATEEDASESANAAPEEDATNEDAAQERAVAPAPKETPRERLVKTVNALLESGAKIVYYSTLLERDSKLQSAYRDANVLRAELEEAFPKYEYGAKFFEPAKSSGSEDDKLLAELLTRWGTVDRLKFDKLVRGFYIPASLLERVLKDKPQFFEFCGKARYSIKAEGREEGRRLQEKTAKLQERLRREINELLDVEGNVVFYSTYFQRNADWLQEIKIDSENALCSRLAHELPERVFYQIYCEGVESTLRFREKVERSIAAAWGEAPILSIDEIASRVYVPREYVQKTLESSFKFIFCGRDKYRRA